MPALQTFRQRLVDPGEISRQNIANNQAMADALLGSTVNPQIQHPTQGLALLAQALNSQLYRQRAERGQSALQRQEAQRLGQLMQSLNLDPQQQQMLQALDPSLQTQIAGQAVAQNLLPGPDESPFAKLDPSDYTQESLRAFQSSSNVADLVPRETDGDVTRIGQRVVRQLGTEAEIYQDAEGRPFYYTDAAGSRQYVSSGDLSTPPERQETGGPGAFDPRTRAQQGQAVTAFQDAAIGATGAVQIASELAQISQATPEALGAPGLILRVGNEFVRTGEALGRMLGTDVGADRDIGGFNFDSFSGDMRRAAVESQAFRAGVYGVAFAAAVAEQGTRPTDRDIQAFIDQIGGSTADPQGFARTLQQFVGRINRRVRTIANVKQIPAEIQQSAYAELDPALAEFEGLFGGGAADELTPEERSELEYRRSLRGNQ